MVYILILLYIVILFFRYDIQNLKEGKNINYQILWGVFVLVAGLSYHVGGDSIGYEITFKNYRFVNSIDDVYDGNLLANSKEPLWVFVNILFSKVFGDFQFLKFAIALFFNTTVFWFIKKHSPKPFFSVLLYAVILGLHLNFQVLRESVAIGLFLIAFDKLCGEKKHYLQYYLIVLVAFMFHRFAFAMLIVPLFFLLKMRWWYYAILGIFLLAGPKVNELMFDSGLFLLDDSLGKTFEFYKENEQYHVENLNVFGILNTIMKIIPIWLLLFWGDDSYNKRVGNAYLLLYVFNAVSIGILFRINDYLLFSFVVTASSSLSRIRSHGKIKVHGVVFPKPIFTIITVLFLLSTIIGHITYERSFEYFPYSSVITKQKVQERENLLDYMW